MKHTLLTGLLLGAALLWPTAALAEEHGEAEILDQKVECLPLEDADKLAKERGLKLAARGRHVAGIPALLYINDKGHWWFVIIGIMPSG